MTAQATSQAAVLSGSTSWRCERFRVGPLTVMVSGDMRSELVLDAAGSGRFTAGGIAVEGALVRQDGAAVFEGTARTPAPWGWAVGSYEDRITQALAGRLACDCTPERLTMRRGDIVVEFVRQP